MTFRSTRIHQGFLGIRGSKAPVFGRRNTLPLAYNVVETVQRSSQLLLINIGNAVFNNQSDSLHEVVARRWRVGSVEERIAAQHSDKCNGNCMYRPFDHRPREWSHTGWFYESVDALMVCAKMLVMRAISWTSWIVNGYHQARFFSPDTARCLNILSRCFGLADYCHQAQARHIKSHLNHVCRQTNIDDIEVLGRAQFVE